MLEDGTTPIPPANVADVKFPVGSTEGVAQNNIDAALKKLSSNISQDPEGNSIYKPVTQQTLETNMPLATTPDKVANIMDLSSLGVGPSVQSGHQESGEIGGSQHLDAQEKPVQVESPAETLPELPTDDKSAPDLEPKPFTLDDANAILVNNDGVPEKKDDTITATANKDTFSFPQVESDKKDTLVREEDPAIAENAPDSIESKILDKLKQVEDQGDAARKMKDLILGNKQMMNILKQVIQDIPETQKEPGVISSSSTSEIPPK